MNFNANVWRLYVLFLVKYEINRINNTRPYYNIIKFIFSPYGRWGYLKYINIKVSCWLY